MIRNILSFLAAAVLISSCGNSTKKEVAQKQENQTGVINVEFASLVSNPTDYIGKNISVEGKVVHVCTMSGKKLFVTGEDPNVMLYVQAGEEMPKFPMELLGSRIVVEGTITRTSGMQMGEGEGMAGETMAKTMGADTCTTAKNLASQPALSDLMMVYNKHELVKD